MRNTIEIEDPNHRPFTISSNYAYYIGYLDLRPDGMGYHKRGEMNGLWYPPLRVLKNIYVSDGKTVFKPAHAEIGYSEARFEFYGTTLQISFQDDNDFEIAVKNASNDVRKLIVELLPETVWYTVNDTRIEVNRRSAIIYSHMFPETRLRIAGSSEFSIENGRLSLLADGKSSLRISSACLHSHRPPIRVNRYRDIDRFSLLRGGGRIGENFRTAKDNLIRLSLINQETGYGLTAGHPDFPWYFGIDTLLSFNGILDAGLFELAFGSLNILARYSKSGKIPHEILTSGKVYNDGDLEETALFPYAVFKYAEWAGYTEEMRHLATIASESFNYLFAHGFHGRGIMEDPKAGEGVDIDTISFTIMSLMELQKVMDMDQEMFGGIADAVKPIEAIDALRKTVQSFWMSERKTFANRIVDGVPVDLGFWTSIIPFYTGIADIDQYRKFVSDGGGLSRISSSSGIVVDASGNSMPVNTGMFVLGSIRYGDAENAASYFKMLDRSLGSFSPGAYPEISNNPQGCYLQAWSAAIYIESIVEGFFGIHSEGGRLISKPFNSSLMPGGATLKNVRFRNKYYDFIL